MSNEGEIRTISLTNQGNEGRKLQRLNSEHYTSTINDDDGENHGDGYFWKDYDCKSHNLFFF